MANKKILTEKDIDYLEKRLKETFPTRNEFKTFRSELFNKLDEILKEVLASREERIIQSHHLSEHGLGHFFTQFMRPTLLLATCT